LTLCCASCPSTTLFRSVLDQEIAHRVVGPQRSFGLRASRSQSPSMLTATTRMQSWIEGKSTIHHEPEKRYWLPTRISVPSEGWLDRKSTRLNSSHVYRS